jgi:hypothetical protein
MCRWRADRVAGGAALVEREGGSDRRQLPGPEPMDDGSSPTAEPGQGNV